jgi:hypothetical protein
MSLSSQHDAVITRDGGKDPCVNGACCGAAAMQASGTQSRSVPPAERSQSNSEATSSAIEATLQAQLDAVVAAGLLQKDDFNERIMAALRSMPVCAMLPPWSAFCIIP